MNFGTHHRLEKLKGRIGHVEVVVGDSHSLQTYSHPFSLIPMGSNFDTKIPGDLADGHISTPYVG